MNRIEIIGHIGNDAEIKDLGTNQVINFSVAVSESYTNKNTGEKITNTTWFECAKWGNNTQIAQYLKKGQQVYIMGKPNNRAWQNEQGEIKVFNGLLVNEIKFLGSRQSNENNSQQEQSQTNSNNDADENDIPF